MRYMNWTILALFFIITGCAVVQIPLFPPIQPLEEQVLEGEGETKILLLNISGIISEKKESKGLGFSKKVSLVALSLRSILLAALLLRLTLSIMN